MKNAPKRIYLCIGEVENDTNFKDLDIGSVTWCADKIYNHDVEYVKAGLYKSDTDTTEIMEHEEILNSVLLPIFADNEDYFSFKNESPDLIDAILTAMEKVRGQSDFIGYANGHSDAMKNAEKNIAFRASLNRFAKPTDQQLIEIAILFNEGKIEPEKLSEMVSMCQFVIDRLYESGDVAKKSSKED